MNFEVISSLKSKRFVLDFSLAEYSDARFDEKDLKLFEECGKSTKISDKLLALETIVRKIEDVE